MHRISIAISLCKSVTNIDLPVNTTQKHFLKDLLQCIKIEANIVLHMPVKCRKE